MKIELVDERDQKHSVETLARFYEGNLIPAEKKPYVVDHRRSTGAFLGVEPGKYLLDAASQIASIGAGFNAGSFFGATHYLESWINDADSFNAKELRESFRDLLSRKLDWTDTNLFFCNSGAEANEIALGSCFEKRRYKSANKVLAFKGSFHGRMMVALASTWNPVKREPFEWPGKASLYVDYPAMLNAEIEKPRAPKGWHALWGRAPERDFVKQVDKHRGKNALLDEEVQSLLAVRRALERREVFAIIVEAMQCEGGDRYSSARFHNGLLNLARAYGVPVIYDEVQTGFALGGTFFWHRIFELQDGEGVPLYPDYVTCAKKSQVGIVLSHEPVSYVEHFAVSSMIRGYLQGMVLDQYEDRIFAIESLTTKELGKLCKRFKKHLSNPRAKGMAFSFDVKDSALIKELVAARFTHGMLYYPAGSNTARFRLSLGYRDDTIRFLFRSLERVMSQVLEKKNVKPVLTFEAKRIDTANQYSFHTALALLQRKLLITPTASIKKDVRRISKELLAGYLGSEAAKAEIVFVTKRNYQKYRNKIKKLEHAVYEPTRVTAIHEFDNIIGKQGGIGLVLEIGGKMAGIAFGSQLRFYPFVRGVNTDPHFEDPKSKYMLDVTVHPSFQGRGIGRVLKYAFVLLSLEAGLNMLHGRNRDKLAAGMLSINLALGAYEAEHLRADYRDFEPHRSSVYYRIPIRWKKPACNLSNAVRAPLGLDELSEATIKKNIAPLVNKITLSNFVTKPYLENIKHFYGLLPEGLRHGYATSGQSECVSKIVKSLWLERKPRTRLLSFEKCFFGNGSFLARSLSAEGEAFFETDHLPFPTKDNWRSVLRELRGLLKKRRYLAVFAEPLSQQFMERMPLEFLKGLRRACTAAGVALVYNDSAGLMHRFDAKYFSPSAVPGIAPDAGFAALGGQMGIVYMREDLYQSSPLLLISTWDGDEFSLGVFTAAAKNAIRQKSKQRDLRKSFEKVLRAELRRARPDTLSLQNGVGWFSGIFPTSLTKHFELSPDGERYLVCPTPSAMKEFVRRYR